MLPAVKRLKRYCPFTHNSFGDGHNIPVQERDGEIPQDRRGGGKHAGVNFIEGHKRMQFTVDRETRRSYIELDELAKMDGVSFKSHY